MIVVVLLRWSGLSVAAATPGHARLAIRWHFDLRGTVLRGVQVVSGLPARACSSP